MAGGVTRQDLIYKHYVWKVVVINVLCQIYSSMTIFVHVVLKEHIW